MRFRRTFHVFVDNFSTTYKLLLYKIIIWVIFGFVCFGVLYPVLHKIYLSDAYNELAENLRELVRSMFNFETSDPGEIVDMIRDNFSSIWQIVEDMSATAITCFVAFFVVMIVQRFFQNLGHFASASMIHDKMAMQAKTRFMTAYTRNLKEASIYSAIFSPLAFIYDVGCLVLLGYIFIMLMSSLLLVRIFLFVLLFTLLTMLRLTLVTDWIPSILFGNAKVVRAMKASFSRKGKGTLGVFSCYIIYVLLIFAINVAAVLLTFGVGLLITLPATYVILFSLQCVNYCDTNNLSYFLDKNTIARPSKEKATTREDFFRGTKT